MFSKVLKWMLCVGAVSSIATTHGAVQVIESFENTADPPNWQAVSPSAQTHNAANPASGSTPIFSTLHVTEGTRSGEFVTTWTLPGTAAGSNPHISGGTLQFWSIRYNVGTPGNMSGNLINTSNGVIVADVFNANPYPLSMAIVCDTNASTQLERGPFIEFPANSSGTYTWDLAATPPVGWITGNGSFDGAPNARVKTMLLYTETEPTAAPSSFFVDNIRNTNAQTDVTAPEVPVPYSVEQGPSAGQLVFTWKPNTEPDLASYRIYLATDADFGTPTTNRLFFPLTPVATVPAGTNTATITVPTEQNVYVQVRAVDNATPVPNETEGGIALGARLRSDGGAVDDHVILDYDRSAPGTAAFALEGYLHGIVYNARALSSNNRYFDSATARAVDAGVETLMASASGITVWGNLLDGSSTSSVALTTESVTALTAFLTAPSANLFISGSGVAEDLSSRGPTQQIFLSGVLLATLLNPNTGDATINATPPLASFGQAITNANNFANTSAYNATSNESLAPIAPATATGQYSTSAQPDAGVVHSNKVVFLGYAFESAAGGDTAASETVRQLLMQDVITYLTGTPVDEWMLY